MYIVLRSSCVSFVTLCMFSCWAIGFHCYSVCFFFTNVLIFRHTAVVFVSLEERRNHLISLLVRGTPGSID